MRILGLDVGSKTIGVAVSDALHVTAQGITTLTWNEKDMSTADDDLKKVIEEYEISEIVVGLPKHMNGTLGERGEISKIYAKRLERIFGIPVHLIDERLTTVAAERTLLEANVSRKKRSQVIDKMAAVMILQNFLDQSL
ncbi:Holliday junction resolvase RuvX [Pseudogracilibacillus auburnensis]|uniref:Putative pre-16S rRNA nuclease n=1 Tax=Pseudogracilibacillus auburnensis TaxID=1494959 RepID=A0A2V3W0I0_9BACI|nr:Holliday junction resolvase RuvX [Pseudogracilibacillus auburnensis]MBO1003435.1 Holliday junction resolvase RuvX [Pseudogracilibacillus auburnensis]PXW86578.1 putative Holliday junction resolvase [Pseudogracilibacillus auburnensis]